MSLDAVRTTAVSVQPEPIISAAASHEADVFDRWRDWSPSVISHHGTTCCEAAREWLIAKDFSSLNGQSERTGPRWLRQRFKWGASEFPIFWCEAIDKTTLDCGALACLTYEIFTARGVICHRVQMVQQFSELSSSQWANSWGDGDSALPWTNGQLIYHEGCAIDQGDEIKVWDPSAGWWVNPITGNGYGSLLAMRISGPFLRTNTPVLWGTNVLTPYEWTDLYD